MYEWQQNGQYDSRVSDQVVEHILLESKKTVGLLAVIRRIVSRAQMSWSCLFSAKKEEHSSGSRTRAQQEAEHRLKIHYRSLYRLTRCPARVIVSMRKRLEHAFEDLR